MRPTNNALTLSVDLGYNNLLADEKKFIENRLNTYFGKAFWELGYKVLSLWYAIERALLNPPICEYIVGRGLDKNDGLKEACGENVAAYVKRIPITVDDLMIAVESKKVEWHTDKWGVCGHSRKCASGKITWVKPHEKGRKRGQQARVASRQF